MSDVAKQNASMLKVSLEGSRELDYNSSQLGLTENFPHLTYVWRDKGATANSPFKFCDTHLGTTMNYDANGRVLCDSTAKGQLGGVICRDEPERSGSKSREETRESRDGNALCA